MTTILTKANLYLGKNLFGKISKVTCPEIDMETTEIKNGFGAYNLPTGIKAMTASITLVGFDKDVFDKIDNPFSEISMTIYGEIDTYTNDTLQKGEQAKLILRGSSQKFGLLGELEQQKNIEQTIDFNISSAKLEIAGKEKFYIDVQNCIFKKDGIDLLATMRKNLALN